MPLVAGQTLSFYEVLEPLGAGAMGEVYRARDTRLGREVAIKVLPEELAADEERLRRFEREARSLAALTHPNVAGIHGVDEQDGLYFLSLELVPGEDLAARLARGPLPVSEAIDVARQLAAGLEAAHEAGVIHRDLKPANVRVTPDGQVKVLDFGLARPVRPQAGEGSTTDSVLTTEAGRLLGTPTYMAPEQARGRPIDRRVDVWAFGCVLFECLTGRRAFEGDSLSDVVAAVLNDEPDLARLPAATPPSVRALLLRCLDKDPRRRLRDAGEARVLLEAPGDEAGAPQPARLAPRLPWLVAGAALALAAWLALGGAPATRPAAALATFTPRTFGDQVVFNARFLPEGQAVVYSAAHAGNRPALYLLQPEAQAPREIAPAGTHLLAVSRSGELAVLVDSEYVYHRQHVGTLARMTVDGAPRPLVERVRDADWGPDGSLAIVCEVDGGRRLEYPLGTVLVETAGYLGDPRVSPDGASVAFLDHPISGDDRGSVRVVDRDGAVRTLTDEYWAVEGLAWSPDGGRLLFSGTPGSTRLQPLSVDLAGTARAELSAPGEVVVLDVAPDGRWLALREDRFTGVAVHVPGRGEVDVSWLDESWGGYLSADGEQVVFTNGRGGDNYAVVRRSLDGSPLTTLGEGDAQAWSPDGAWVAAILSAPGAIMLLPTGPGAPRRLESGPLERITQATWTPDGEHLLIIASEPGQRRRNYLQAVSGGAPRPVTPEGVAGALAPPGDRIVARDLDWTWKWWPLDGGAPDELPGIAPEEYVFALTPDGEAALVAGEADVPLTLARVDLTTGERGPGPTVGPADTNGVMFVWMLDRVLDPAGRYVYSYQRRRSQLFLVTPP